MLLRALQRILEPCGVSAKSIREWGSTVSSLPVAVESKAIEPSSGEDKEHSDVLSGQYYIYINYRNAPFFVRRTQITPSKNLLKIRKHKKVQEESSIERDNKVLEILKSYKKIHGYASVGSELSNDMKVISSMKLDMELGRLKGKSIDLVRSRRRSRVYISKSLNIKDVNRSIDRYWHADRNSGSVARSVFVGMVTMFDEMISKLIREIIISKPELINSFSLSVDRKSVV